MYHTQIKIRFILPHISIAMFFTQITHVVTCIGTSTGIQHDATGGIAFVEVVDATYADNPGSPRHVHWNNALPHPGHFIIT